MKVTHVTNTDGQHYGYSFKCPGCGDDHVIPTPPHERAWTFNGDTSRPTFTPSILVRYSGEDGGRSVDEVCHSHVTEGRIQFLEDCTHPLAGQTVDLPDLP